MKAGSEITTKSSKRLLRQAETVSELLASLAHPNRLILLCELAGGRKTVSMLQEACGVSQAKTSQFLARLRAEGRVVSEREGNLVYYELVDPRLGVLLKAIDQIFCRGM